MVRRSDDRPVHIALAGHGRWGRAIERTLAAFPGVSLSILPRGAPAPAGIDGVIVATPSATHAQIALPSIQAGIPTFIEKPMTTALADAERLADAAHRSGAAVFVGHILLHHPAFLAAHEILPTLGPLRFILCEGMNGNPRKDSSVLWDWLPHDLTIGRAIFAREPDAVTAWSLAGGANPTAAATRFDFGEVPMSSTMSWHYPARRRVVTFACADATLVFDDYAERRLALYRAAEGEPMYPSYAADLPLTREMEAFLNAVRSRKADDAHLQSGVSIVRAIAAAEASLLGGGQTIAI